MAAELTVVKSGEHAPPASKRFLRLRDVIAMTGLSRSTIYRKLSEGSFPQPIHVTEFRVGWSEATLVEWMNEREKLSCAVA